MPDCPSNWPPGIPIRESPLSPLDDFMILGLIGINAALKIVDATNPGSIPLFQVRVLGTGGILTDGQHAWTWHCPYYDDDNECLVAVLCQLHVPVNIDEAVLAVRIREFVGCG